MGQRALAMPERNFERMPTGIEGLDHIFGGGLLRENSLLLIGPPGSAKTTLGAQIIVNGARDFSEPGIILCFEQPPAQLIRDTAAFDWDLKGLHDKGQLSILIVKPEDLYRSLTSEDSPVVQQLRGIVAKRGSRRILVDGVSNFFRVHKPLEEQDQNFIEFLAVLKELRLTSILTAEEESHSSPRIHREEYVADAVARLRFAADTTLGRPARWLETTKMRGQSFLEGRHPFRIGAAGIEVFPRIFPAAHTMEDGIAPHGEMCSTGVEGLDEMLGGGLLCGSITILAGMEGAGKTTIGAHFLDAGLRKGEPGLLLTFEETPTQVVNNMASRGIALRGHVESGLLRILHVVPIGVSLLETYYEVKAMIARDGIQRLVVDSVNDARRELNDAEENRYYWMLFSDLFRRGGVTALMLEQTRHSQGLETLAQIEHASFVDAIIYMGFAEIEGRLTKIASVLKSRHSDLDGRIREVVMTDRGAQVVHGLRGLSGILDGAPVRSFEAERETALRLLKEARLSLEGSVATSSPAGVASARARLMELETILGSASSAPAHPTAEG